MVGYLDHPTSISEKHYTVNLNEERVMVGYLDREPTRCISAIKCIFSPFCPLAPPPFPSRHTVPSRPPKKNCSDKLDTLYPDLTLESILNWKILDLKIFVLRIVSFSKNKDCVPRFGIAVPLTKALEQCASYQGFGTVCLLPRFGIRVPLTKVWEQCASYQGFGTVCLLPRFGNSVK